jgi:2-oxoglutarate dehydrogenase E1 component
MLPHLHPCSVKPEILKRVGEAMTTLPKNFKPHRAVKKIFDLRHQMIETGEGIDWAVGEALAFATLIVEGNHVRLSGQDVERGTFSIVILSSMTRKLESSTARLIILS